MKRIAPKKAQLDRAEEAVQSLSDADFSSTAAVEVQTDAVVSAFLDLMQRKKKVADTPALADVLSEFVEADIVNPSAVALADEIDNLIRTKDYEGYSDEYLAESFENLLSDLENELEAALQRLRAKTSE